MSKILIFGATSAIAIEAARVWAGRGDSLLLVARDRKKLTALQSDLKARGAAKVAVLAMDALDFSKHASLGKVADQALGGLDQVLVAHGVLSDEAACRAEAAAAMKDLQVNFSSVVSVLTPLANRFEKEGKGVIACISSVAGDRARQSNYVYGTAKAGVSAYLGGLRNRLARSGVAVVTIKPGFVDTPMTAHLKKNPLFASARTVGRGVVKAMDKRKDVAYLPGFWKPILLMVIHIPEGMFKRMKM